MQYLLVFFLLNSFIFDTKANEDTEKANESINLFQQSIVEVNISYDLFTALAEYAELTQSENSQHIDINAKMIPVLETILREYSQELQKYHELLIETPNQILQLKVSKLAEYAKDFRQELIYRKKALELNDLIKQQQMIKQGK